MALVETDSDRQESSSHQRWGFGYRAGPGLDEMALKIFLCSDQLFCPWVNILVVIWLLISWWCERAWPGRIHWERVNWHTWSCTSLLEIPQCEFPSVDANNSVRPSQAHMQTCYAEGHGAASLPGIPHSSSHQEWPSLIRPNQITRRGDTLDKAWSERSLTAIPGSDS